VTCRSAERFTLAPYEPVTALEFDELVREVLGERVHGHGDFRYIRLDGFDLQRGRPKPRPLIRGLVALDVLLTLRWLIALYVLDVPAPVGLCTPLARGPRPCEGHGDDVDTDHTAISS
jgi:hypothetical protein